MNTFNGIRAGDRVTFVTLQGDRYITCSGRAQLLLCFPTHVVVNLGGRYGTPAVVNADNYVRHTPRQPT